MYVQFTIKLGDPKQGYSESIIIPIATCHNTKKHNLERLEGPDPLLYELQEYAKKWIGAT